MNFEEKKKKKKEKKKAASAVVSTRPRSISILITRDGSPWPPLDEGPASASSLVPRPDNGVTHVRMDGQVLYPSKL